MSVENPHRPEAFERESYINTIIDNLNGAGIKNLAKRFSQEVNDRPYLTIAKGGDQSELRAHELASQWLIDAVKIIAGERDNHNLFSIPKSDVISELGSNKDFNLDPFPEERQAFKMMLIALGGLEGVDNDKIDEVLKQPIAEPNRNTFVTKNPVVIVYVRFGIDNIEFELGAVD